jgi:hypothetical protein
MKNGIINNIDTSNIFASQDRNLFFVPVVINTANLTEDIYVSCLIKRKYYTTRSKPTHLSNSLNLSRNIEFDQIKGSYDSLTRKLFSKNISIKSGQREIDKQKILVNKSVNEIEGSTTIFCSIKKTTLEFLFADQDYSHVFTVYATNKENNIVEIASSDQESANPFSYLQNSLASRSITQNLLDQLLSSTRITITPFFHRRSSFSSGILGRLSAKSLLDSGINLKYNNTLLRTLSEFFNGSFLGIKIKCGDTTFFANANDIDRINFLLLREENFISDVLSKAQELSDSATLDFEITFYYSLFFQSEKIFQVEASKIKKIKESFYSYYKYKYFQEGRFFTVEAAGSNILIKINNSIVDSNKELYNMLSNVSIVFKVSDVLKTKLYFAKGSQKRIETSSHFLFKNIVTKSFDKLYIKNSNINNLSIQCVIPQIDLGGRPISVPFDIYPLQTNEDDGEESTNDSDECETSTNMSDNCEDE